MKQLSAELGEFGITVNSVAPGFMPTSPDYIRQWDSYGDNKQKVMIENIAMRRIGEPNDIANAVIFFASDFASWITGQTLAVTVGHKMPSRSKRISIAVDIGGTFTDIVLADRSNNSFFVTKTSSTPDNPALGFFQG